jgi:hypothetical protein
MKLVSLVKVKSSLSSILELWQTRNTLKWSSHPLPSFPSLPVGLLVRILASLALAIRVGSHYRAPTPIRRFQRQRHHRIPCCAGRRTRITSTRTFWGSLKLGALWRAARRFPSSVSIPRGHACSRASDLSATGLYWSPFPPALLNSHHPSVVLVTANGL